MCLAGWGVLMLIKLAEEADWKKGWEGARVLRAILGI